MRTSVLLLLISLALSAAMAQGWEWQNTEIQGNNLAHITFSPDGHYGWCTSLFGDVLQSTDHGTSWSLQTSNQGLVLYDEVFTDSVHGWAITNYEHSISYTSDGGLTWNTQYTVPWGWLNDLTFRDANHGWGVGYGMIVHTTNGGQSWTMQDSLGWIQLNSVSFDTPQEGWVSGAWLLHTINGGVTWTPISQSNPANGQLEMFEDGRGWGIQQYGQPDACKLLRTIDGDLTWFPQMCNGDTIRTLASFDFVDDSTGWAVGSGGDIFHTTNAGVLWTRQTSGTTGTLNSVKATSHSDVWIAGDGGVVMRTTNGGANWSAQAGNAVIAGYNLACVHFADTLNGWAAGSGGIVLRTTNGGGEWNRLNPGCSFDLKHLAVIDPLTLWIAGESDTFPHTTNGGASWTPFVANNTNPWNYGTPLIAHAGADHLWILADSVCRSTDGGATWTGHDWESLTTLPYPTSFVFTDESTGWICSIGDQGGSSILRTDDGGITWSQIYITDDELFALTFINPDTGWVIAEAGEVRHTTDGGFNWTELSDPPASGRGCLQFTDALNGWNIQGARFIHTTDGGVTWDSVSSPCGNGINAMHFVDANHGWAVGNNGAIIAYHGPLSSTSHGRASILPTSFSLSAYPNPFNPTTILSFDVPANGRVQVSIYDLTGRLVQTLADQVYAQGNYRVMFNGSDLASGIYFARLCGPSFAKTQKLVLLK